MIRIVKWQFPQNNPYMFSKDIVIGDKVMLSKLQAKGWQWAIIGLGLSKAEREIFGGKRFESRGILNIYLGKLLVSYNRDGYKDHMRGVSIVLDKVLI